MATPARRDRALRSIILFVPYVFFFDIEPVFVRISLGSAERQIGPVPRARIASEELEDAGDDADGVALDGLEDEVWVVADDGF